MTSRVYRLSLCGIFCAAAILRLWRIGAAPLWYDEAFTVLLARLDVGSLLLATAGDVHPPLWYLIQWLLVRIAGESALVMRLPSALASLAGLYLTWRLAERLGLSRSATVAAVGFLALDSTQVWYAQEARGYSLLMALVLAQVLTAYSRRWVLFAAATIAAIYLHNYGAIYSAVIGVWLLVREIRAGEPERTLPGALLALIVPVMSYAPWTWSLYNQMSQVAAGYWIPPIRLGTVIYCLSAITYGFTLSGPLESVAPLVFVGAIALSAVRQRRQRLLLWLAGAPSAVVAAVSVAWKPVLLFRGLIGSVPAIVLLCAEALAGDGQSKRNRIIAGVILAPVVVAGLVTLQTSYDRKGHDADLIAQYVQYQPGDALVHVNDGSWVIYAAASELPQYELLTDCPDPVGSLSVTTREELGVQRARFDDLRARFDRLWLIGGTGSTSTQCEVDMLRDMIARADAQEIYRDVDSRYTLTGIWRYE